MKRVYLLEHCYEEGNHEDVKTIGIYTSEEKAVAAKNRKLECSGFCMYPDGFIISEIELDSDLWSEGFGVE
ncbi:hypothetical protein ACMZOO_00870 [Catenovulum sp. SX2]|uniref:DUF7336 domain-containing protein n=1 Tax=Catenovulum sp. SX2 TaxID=3398614 RepID=UPI003F878AD2